MEMNDLYAPQLGLRYCAGCQRVRRLERQNKHGPNWRCADCRGEAGTYHATAAQPRTSR